MYADYDYYTTEYCGTLVEKSVFDRYARQATRLLDAATTNKLQFAFPKKETDVLTVRDCQCDLVEFLYRVQMYQNSAHEATGTIHNPDGTVRGKSVSSVTSGSESISYSVNSGISTDVAEAAKDPRAKNAIIYEIIKSTLSRVPDANGVNLLYAGAYPGKRDIWV